jgi:hypothetical protein
MGNLHTGTRTLARTTGPRPSERENSAAAFHGADPRRLLTGTLPVEGVTPCSGHHLRALRIARATKDATQGGQSRRSRG